MLIVATFLAGLATALFLIETARSNWTNLLSGGLAALAASVAVYLVYLLEETGKL
jgi:hypothetical protein